MADPEISRFPRKGRPYMPGSQTTPGPAGARINAPASFAFREVNNVGTRIPNAFAAQWLAYTLPYRRFAVVLAGSCARIGDDVGCYSFIAVDFHHIPLAGLPAHSLALFSKAFEKMAELLAALPSGPARVPALYLLFDMIVGIAPHCDEPEALTFDCLRRWLTLAEGCREPGAPPHALDRSITAVLVKWTMEHLREPVACHSELQKWVGGVLDDTPLREFEPNPLGLDERRLAPDATPEGWNSAWRAMTSTTTPWASACALVCALESGSPWQAPPGASPEELSALQRIASGRVGMGKMAVIAGKPGRGTCCPACRMELPLAERSRLRTGRIATCGWCQRVVLDLSI